MMKPWILGVCAAFVPLTLTACAVADTPANTASTRVTLTGTVSAVPDAGFGLVLQDNSAYVLQPLWNQELNIAIGDQVRVYADKTGNTLKVRNLRVLQRGNPMEPEREILQFSLATDKTTYRRGETVNFTMTLRNNSNQPQQLSFNSGQTFDVSATPQGADEPIWRWAQGRMFTRAIREVTIEPGQTLTFPAEWDQTNAAGDIVPRGEYTLRAELAATKRIKTTPVTIRLND